MKIHDLEPLLGEYYKLCIHPAYSESYLYVARHNNAEVSPERIDKIRSTINHHIKELKRTERKLGKH